MKSEKNKQIIHDDMVQNHEKYKDHVLKLKTQWNLSFKDIDEIFKKDNLDHLNQQIEWSLSSLVHVNTGVPLDECLETIESINLNDYILVGE